MQKLQFLLLFGVLLLRVPRDELINKIVREEEDPIILVVSSFKGKVIAENGTPVSGATVRVYNATTTTDAQVLLFSMASKRRRMLRSFRWKKTDIF